MARYFISLYCSCCFLLVWLAALSSSSHSALSALKSWLNLLPSYWLFHFLFYQLHFHTVYKHPTTALHGCCGLTVQLQEGCQVLGLTVLVREGIQSEQRENMLCTRSMGHKACFFPGVSLPLDSSYLQLYFHKKI